MTATSFCVIAFKFLETGVFSVFQTWIRDKGKLIESTDELGNDLGGIITLQRRLGGLERDLAAIDAKVQEFFRFRHACLANVLPINESDFQFLKKVKNAVLKFYFPTAVVQMTI